MINSLVLILCLFATANSFASNKLYETKKELVKELKILFKHNTKYWNLEDPKKVSLAFPVANFIEKPTRTTISISVFMEGGRLKHILAMASFGARIQP